MMTEEHNRIADALARARQDMAPRSRPGAALSADYVARVLGYQPGEHGHKWLEFVERAERKPESGA